MFNVQPNGIGLRLPATVTEGLFGNDQLRSLV
jgi:hypothetical protein